DAPARERRPRPDGGRAGLAPCPQFRGTCHLRPADLLARRGGELRPGLAAGAMALPWTAAARAALGLRLSRADGAHAGHSRRLRPADPPDLRAAVSHAGRATHALRYAAALPRDDRGPDLALAVPADRAGGGPAGAVRRPAAAGAHRRVSPVQLCDAGHCAAVGHPMTIYSVISQLLEIVVALTLAPLLSGWVNQWRAWLQNKSAPPLLQPYFLLHKLFNKESVVATHASPLFRGAPYIVFGCM